MTYTELRERVAEAISAERYYHRTNSALADAAIRVVGEACALVCLRRQDHFSYQRQAGAVHACGILVDEIRALTANPQGEKA